MSDLREAAEMALEALEIWEKMQPNTTACAARIPAIQTLRQALAQPEQRGHCTCGDPTILGYVHFRTRPCIYYTEPLAQPEQEPEWIDDGFGTIWQKCGKKDCGKFVVKIGKVDCWNGDCPEAKEKNA